MIRQSRKIQFIILLTLVCLVGTMTIAYAILSTTLNITGNTEVIASSWNVHFANIQPNPMSVTPTKSPTITDSKTIDFSVVLNKPGDFYKFNVDIVNDGSINAMIDSVIKNPTLTDEQAKYIKYEIEYINGESISSKQLLKSGETKTISVLLSYRTDITSSDLPTTPTTLNLSIELNYIQADTTSTEVTTSPKKISVVNGDLNTVGSEICKGEECFYLMENDGYKVTILAKYNLYVGYHCVNISAVECTSYGEKITGKQDSTMLGWIISDATPRNGTIEFSTTNYWIDEKNKYPAYVYNSNSIIYQYVENYKTYLHQLGTKVENARLISYEEMIKLDCDPSSSDGCLSSQYDWLYSTTYWTGSAYSEDKIWSVISNGHFRDGTYSRYLTRGVRPVIEVPLTEF